MCSLRPLKWPVRTTISLGSQDASPMAATQAATASHRNASGMRRSRIQVSSVMFGGLGAASGVSMVGQKAEVGYVALLVEPGDQAVVH